MSWVAVSDVSGVGPVFYVSFSRSHNEAVQHEEYWRVGPLNTPT